MGLLNIGEATSAKKMAGNMGDPKNYPHLKKYGAGYGGIIASGLFIMVIAIPLTNSILDFFCPNPVKGHVNGDHNQRGDRNRNR